MMRTPGAIGAVERPRQRVLGAGVLGIVAFLLASLVSCDDLDGRASGVEDGELSPKLQRVVVSNRGGSVTIRRGREYRWRWSLSVEARSDEEAERIVSRARLVNSAQSSASFTLAVPDGEHCRATSRLELEVPRRCSVVIENYHGKVSVEGIEGGGTIRQHHGNLHLEGTKGNLDLDLRHCRSRIARQRGDLRIRSNHGGLQLSDLRGSLDLVSEHSRTRMKRLRGGARIELEFSNLDLDDFEGGDVEIAARHSDLDLTGGDHDLVVTRCEHGDIRLRRTEARKIALQARYGRIDLAIGNDTRSVEARTEHEDIRVRVPKNRRRSIEARGRVVRVFGRKHGRYFEQIDSDACLKLELDAGRRGNVQVN